MSIESFQNESVAGEADSLEQVAEAVDNVEHEAQQETQTRKAEEDQFSAKFAALSRREKEMRKLQSDLERRSQELEERFKAFEAERAPKEPAKLPLDKRLLSNPLEALKEMGISYEKLTEMALNEGQVPVDLQMKLMRQELEEKHAQELADLRNELIEDKKSREQEKYNQTYRGFINQINDVLNGSDDYELSRAHDASELVYEVMEEHYKETKEIMDIKEAAAQVERYLEEELDKMTKLSKFQKKYGSSPSKPVEQKRQSPTLSNAHASKASVMENSMPLSHSEQLAKAASLIKWNDD